MLLVELCKADASLRVHSGGCATVYQVINGEGTKTMTRLGGALALCALLAAAGCFGPRGDTDPARPRSQGEWTVLVSEVRTFERAIGFEPTDNFRSFAGETEGF